MPTLIERVQGLTQEIRQMANAKVSETEADAFRTRDGELSDAANAIAVPAKFIELFGTKGLKVETPVQQARRLKSTIDEIAAKYDVDPLSIAATDTSWRFSTKPGLDRISRDVMEQLMLGWRKYVGNLKPEIDQGLIILLQNSSAYANHANKVREISSALDELAHRLPSTQDDFNKPEKLAADLNLAIENLPDDIPEPVRALFLAINSRVATAGHLTDDALTWLREKEMLDTIAVSWR